MKKKLLSTVLCFAAITLLVGCGNSEKEEQKKESDTFFKIVDEIKSGDYEKALKNLESAYGSVDYSDGSDGVNKMLQYRLYYDKKQMYEEEMDVLINFLQANNFEDVLKSKEVSLEKENIKMTIGWALDILDKVSEDRKEKAIDIIGQDNLDASKEKKN